MSFPFLGHGVGLRVPHYERALEGRIDVDWVEVITENFFGGGGRPRAVLERLRRDRPLVFHGVSLSAGSADGVDAAYVRRLAALAHDFEPAWLSDHLCWSRLGDRHSHDLLPLPYTEEALAVVSENVARVQDALRRPILLENVSSYVAFRASQMPEWQFLSEVVARTGCGILLDLNNVLVSAFNHGNSPWEYLDGLVRGAVHQFHLANHSQREHYRFDDHRGPVPDAVWELYAAAVRRFGRVSSLVEWDEDIPAWEVLRAEQRKAAEIMLATERAMSGAVAPSPELQRAQPVGAARARETLASMQALFLDAIAWPTGVEGFLASSSEATRDQFAGTFAESAPLDRVARMNVYADSYFYRLLAGLREMFPRLARSVPEPVFHNLVTDYVLAYPPREPDLRRLGDELPEYLAQHALGVEQPLLAEVARLERALCRALDAAPGAQTTAEELAHVPPAAWPELGFALSPPSELCEMRFEIERLPALGELERRGEPLQLEALSEARHVLIGRRGLTVYFRAANPLEAAALQAFQRGCRLGEVCVELSQKSADFQPDAMVQWLRQWLADGLLERRAS